MAYMKDKKGRRLDSFEVMGTSEATAQFTRKRRPVARNVHLPTRNAVVASLSDGVSTGITTQLEHTFDVACTGVQATFINSYNNNGTPADGPNPITVKAALRRNGVNVPWFIQGVRSRSIDGGGILTSDAVGMSFKRGDVAYSHTGVSVTAGQKYPLGLTTRGGVEGVVAGDSVDGSVAGGIAKSYGPALITGVPLVPIDSPIIGFVCDSNGAGFNDLGIPGTDAYGYIRRAMDGKLSYVNCSYSGVGASNSNTEAALRQRLALADTLQIDDWYLALGTNDSYTTEAERTTLKNNLVTIANLLLQRGQRVWCATLPPRTTSTDAWATTGNQTALASESGRVAMNAWFRSVPAPFSGCFDIADALETARDSGIWKAGYTIDGTHIGANGAPPAAAVLNPATFGSLLPAA